MEKQSSEQRVPNSGVVSTWPATARRARSAYLHADQQMCAAKNAGSAPSSPSIDSTATTSAASSVCDAQEAEAEDDFTDPDEEHQVLAAGKRMEKTPPLHPARIKAASFLINRQRIESWADMSSDSDDEFNPRGNACQGLRPFVPARA